VIPESRKTSVWQYLFSRDTLVATILVFVVIFTFARLENAIGLFDPKDMTAKDFDYNDLAFNLLSKYKNIPVDTDIYIVDIGNDDRKRIAAVIDTVCKAKPKVVAVDVLFNQPKNEEQDSALKRIFRTNKLVVSAYQLDSVKNRSGDTLAGSSGKKGFVNFTLENQNVIRQFNPYIGTPETNLSFSAAIVKAADPGSYQKLLARNHPVETINYAGNENKFIIISGDDSSRTDFNILKGKIVIVGSIATGSNYEDKHFTPLNAAFTGKSWPDLSGVVIQANIVRMMLANNYIKHWAWWLNWLFAFVICWVHMAFFISYFIEKHIWFHLAAKLAQLISSVVFVFLGLFLFYDFNEQIDMSGALIGIILAVDVLYFYEAGVIWLHHKKGYKTLFHHEYPN